MESKSKFLFDGTEFLNQSQKSEPFTFKNIILLAPGEWNDNKYTNEEIKKAYEDTDWKDKSNFSLYLDHQDTKQQGVANWAGYVKNIHLDENATLLGDLEVWNTSLIVYLKEAKAKFGVSATLKGKEDSKNNTMKDFKFESFSIVTNPACKEAWINLSQNSENNERRLKIITMAKEVEETQPAKEEEVEKEEPKEEPKEEVENQDEPEPKPEIKKKKPEPKEEEMSENSVLGMLSSMTKEELSEYSDFVGKMRGKYPDISFKDIASAWSKEKKMGQELQNMSDIELLDQIHERYSILKLRKQYPSAEETASEKVDKLSNEVKALNEKLKEGERKTLSSSSPVSSSNEDPMVGMAKFIQSGGQGVFGMN